MRIVELDHIAINVHDVDRSLDFYKGILGLEVLRLAAFREGKVRFVSVRVSRDTIIDLFPVEGGSGEAAALNHFCLVTDSDDLDELCARVESAGHKVNQRPSVRWGARGDGRSAYLMDPDGNIVEVRTYQGVPPRRSRAAHSELVDSNSRPAVPSIG